MIAAILYAISLYWKSTNFNDRKGNIPFWLGILRFLSVGTLAFLLLMPFIKHLIESQQDPIIIVAEDRSQSITATTSEEDISTYLTDMNALVAGLSESYEVKRFAFGEEILTSVTDSFTGQTTNISNQIKHLEDQFSDLNVGAIILATDGIYNEGNNPLYADAKFKAPIHTVALGDTTRRRDLMIKNVLSNRIAYLGDAFNIQIDVQAFNAAGSASKLTVEKIIGGKPTKVKDETFNIGSNNYFKTFSFDLDATDIGNVKYRVRLDRISDELSSQNNSRTIYIEILDARQKILLLANAPHPDLSALANVVEANKNYEVKIEYAKNPVANLGSYDIVFLHNLPSNRHNISSELTALKSRKIPTIFFTGSQINLSKFNQAQNVVSISGNVSSMNEVQSTWNSGFNGYIVAGQLKSILPKFPPVFAPFGEYTLGPKTEVLLNQKIGKVETNYPLISYSDFEDWKTTVFSGEGFWRWKIHEFQTLKMHRNMEELVNKMIQYTSKKDDKRKFKAFVSKNVIKENEEVLFDAQLYNNNYELVNDPDVFLTVSDDKKNNYDYTFSKSNNYYTLNVGLLPEGNYSYTANTTANGEALKSSGNFSVQTIQKEQFELTANHGMLKSLSDRYGGQMFYPNQIAALQDSISNSAYIKPVIYQRNKTESLLNMKWIFLIVGALLCIEWFMRRYFGSY